MIIAKQAHQIPGQYGVEISGTIKAHAGAADIFEWTLGYTIGRNPNRMSVEPSYRR
ncbi:MAG TPA: hypothetical protein VJ911_00130 [Cryomorphaceae bacterium]|nr:hypothetical protein [Cryomorphaceae bacterium]